jgi:uncharacterized protein DUF2460
MPGSVHVWSPTLVLPATLSRAFSRTQELNVHSNDYAAGTSHREKLVETPRRRWRLAKRLTLAQLQELRDFYLARKGPTEPFYFYDPFETKPRFSHDATGLSLHGRFVVRFVGPWQESANWARMDVESELIEVA